MRATLRKTLQGLVLILLGALSAGVSAQESAMHVNLPWGASHQLAPRDVEQKKWVCEYMRAPDGVLYMYCEDLVSLLYDELSPEEEAQAASAKYFPLWSTPKSDRNAVELAELLLCGKQGRCSVELARNSSSMRVAQF